MVLSLQAGMDILTTALIWLYPANDFWTLLLWIPVWSIIIGLLEIRSEKVSEIGLWRVGPWLGATALLFGISISIWPPLVFTFTGAAIIVLGGLLLVSAFRPERNLRDENSRRYHWAPTALATVVRHMK
ncbi:MAG TPA: hypothetical protein VMF91_10250 [Bryobacteraceae bacterium]|nr:hypothetical protein [Bryobacteraceae bacterium]